MTAFVITSVLALPLLSALAQDTTRSREYTGPNGVLSVTVPRAPNWAGVPYKTTALDTKGDKRYDKVMLHSDDFGQYLVAGARVVPTHSISEMNKDEPRTVLRNISQAALFGWRTDLPALPEIAQESWIDTKYGEAIVRVYRAKKGSFLIKDQGPRREGRPPTHDDAFDTNIASIVARQGAIVVFVFAQNDWSPDDADLVVRMAAELFQVLRVSAGR
jgi:hypothetical protein